MAENPIIKVVHLQKDLVKAIKLFDKFLKKNNLRIKYSITLDYSLKAFGVYFPDETYNIYINPEQFYDTSKEDPNAMYYTHDVSIMNVVIHESAHMLDQKFKLSQKYREAFKEKFILNDNSNRNVYEEWAEMFSIFITNPFLFKIIDKERFNFLKKQFDSPTPCTKANFLRKYKAWPKQIQKLCQEQWGISVNGTKVTVKKKEI